MKNNSVIKPVILIITAALFLSFVFDMSSGTGSVSFLFMVICTSAVIALFWKNIDNRAVFLTMLSGMMLRIAYIIYTPVWCRQHDVVDFGAGEGHAAYMEYILSHKALPDFDPRSVWAFFQPPLHHTISAAFMWINIKLGISADRMHENVQILPLVYMCLLILVVYFICRQLGMSSRGTFVTMLIVSFSPIYILMSGSINNDALAIMLSVVSVYVAILWYMYPTTGKILLLAVSVGLAMAAKLSSALIAPGIGAMMIYKIVKDTRKFSERPKVISYILELVVFAPVVSVLGLFWPVRNKILFDMPPGYIPGVGEQIEKTDFVSRILDVRTASPFLYMRSNGFSYDEYNLLLATLKSALFGEGDFAGKFAALSVTGWLLLFAAAVLLIVMTVSAAATVFSKEASPDTGIKILLGLEILCGVIGYIIFAVSGKNLSAMNFRYSAFAVAFLALFTGIRYDRLNALGKRAGKCVIMSSSAVFAALACIFYLLVGLI